MKLWRVTSGEFRDKSEQKTLLVVGTPPGCFLEVVPTKDLESRGSDVVLINGLGTVDGRQLTVESSTGTLTGGYPPSPLFL
jgi:hypothetical protein